MLDLAFFFFKQETAYEMRIRDWSSDVCSSDLLCSASQFGAGLRSRCVDQRAIRITMNSENRRAVYRGLHPTTFRSTPPCSVSVTRASRGDRKSVVSGKSVSVRVDLGGRRIITKKTEKIVINKQSTTKHK